MCLHHIQCIQCTNSRVKTCKFGKIVYLKRIIAVLIDSVSILLFFKLCCMFGFFCSVTVGQRPQQWMSQYFHLLCVEHKGWSS